LLGVWNILALGLVITIVTIAVLSFPAPLQQLAFDQPNLAVAYFPYVWLPTVVVPIVLFCHAASLYKIWANKLN
jgi:FtsH-binding integral membrane protein